MPNNAILALFYVLSENSMAFSRPEYLATMLRCLPTTTAFKTSGYQCRYVKARYSLFLLWFSIFTGPTQANGSKHIIFRPLWVEPC